MGEVGVSSAGVGIAAPVAPVYLLFFGSLRSDPSGDSTPRRHKVTRNARSFGNWTSFQNLSCDNGKCKLKYDIKFVQASETFPSWNARDVTSVIVFSSPAICKGMRWDASVAWICSRRRRMSCPAMTEQDVHIL